MEKQITVLVLGVGGNVGQGILKALACSNINCRVVGACTSAAAYGLYIVDRAFVSPPANSTLFLDWLLGVCEGESVSAILCGVEPVLKFLVDHQELIREKTGAICVVNDRNAMEIAADKLVTCEWLREHGFPYPKYASSEDAAAIKNLVTTCGFPLIAKPRFGKGSQGIFELKGKNELALLSQLSNYVVQEYVGDIHHEYTAAAFTDRDDCVRGIVVFQRMLTAGTTSFARAGEFPEVREMSRQIVERLKPKGPCNMQYRMNGNEPICFEINARFSGTVPIRASLGFNDVEAALLHYVLGRPASYLPVVNGGVAVRYWNEAYISVDAFETLKRMGRLDSQSNTAVSVESYQNKK